jgi:hypothetical protein
MANKIIIKKSSTASQIPTALQLDVGELAVNLADQKLYSKNAGGTVVLVGTGVSGSTPIMSNTTTVDSNLSINTGQNGLSVGPMTIGIGYTVTIGAGQRWAIL